MAVTIASEGNYKLYTHVHVIDCPIHAWKTRLKKLKVAMSLRARLGMQSQVEPASVNLQLPLITAWKLKIRVAVLGVWQGAQIMSFVKCDRWYCVFFLRCKIFWDIS